MADIGRVIIDLDIGEGIGRRGLVEEERIALHIRLRIRRTLVDLEETTIGRAARTLRDRLRDHLRARVRSRVDDLSTGVLVLAIARVGDRHDVNMCTLTEYDTGG